jgi:hypothetical protein
MLVSKRAGEGMLLEVKKTLSWTVALLGIVTGTLAAVVFARAAIPQGPSLDHWLFLVTPGLYSFARLSGSFVAFRNPRKAAGLFSLAVPAWGLSLGRLDYRALFHTGDFTWLAFVFLILSIPVLLGLFWFLTHRLGWQPILTVQPRPTFRRFLGNLAVGALILGIVSAGAIFLELNARSWDCGELPPFAQKQYPGQAVFVARPVHAGRLRTGPGFNVMPLEIGIVEKRYWGLRWWEHDVALVWANFKPSESYFIEGTHWPGLITQFFPVVVFTPCGHTSSLKEAAVEIRLLRDGPPKDGVRIIGQVSRSLDHMAQPAPDVSILISGPAGSITTTTDAEGVYDVTRLPPGRYRVEIAPPNPRQPPCRESYELKTGDVWGCRLFVATF